VADLATEVQARYSAEKIAQLTNPDVPNALTVDTVRLANAVRDVISDFNVHANTVFDQTNDDHIATGVEGVILKLQMRQLNADPSDLRKQWIEMLEALGQSVGGRTKTQPVSDAVATPSADEVGSHPEFDRSRFDHLTPNSPGGSTASGLPTENQ
jgi:hypothetical protein